MTDHDLSRTDAGMLRAVMAASGDGLLCVDDDGRIAYANPVGDLDARPPGRRRRRARRRDRGARRPRASRSTCSREATSRRRRPRRSSAAAPTSRGSGEAASPKLIGMSLHDVTETRGKQDRAEAVLNATTDGLIVLNPSDVIKYINPAATRMLELPRKDAIGVKVDLERLFGIDAERPAGGGALQRGHGLRQDGLPRLRRRRPALLAHERDALRERPRAVRVEAVPVRAVRGPADERRQLRPRLHGRVPPDRARPRRGPAGDPGAGQPGRRPRRRLRRPSARAARHHQRARDRPDEERVRVDRQPRAPHAADLDQGLRRPHPRRRRRRDQRDPAGVPRHREGELRPARRAHQRHARHLAHRVGPHPLQGAADGARRRHRGLGRHVQGRAQPDRPHDQAARARGPAACRRRPRPRRPGAHQLHQQRAQVLARTAARSSSARSTTATSSASRCGTAGSASPARTRSGCSRSSTASTRR